VYSSYHVCFIKSHKGHNPLPLDMQLDNTDPNLNGPTTTSMPVLSHNNDEDEVIPPIPPNLDITMQPVPKTLCRSPWVPIPTKQNPTGRPSTTCTEVAVQESKERQLLARNCIENVRPPNTLDLKTLTLLIAMTPSMTFNSHSRTLILVIRCTISWL
jgi:hypothetical protein